jgi:hypothetical protein
MAQMGSSAFDTLSFASSSSSASNSSFGIGGGASASDNADKVLIWSMRKVMYDVTELLVPKSRRSDEIFDTHNRKQRQGDKETRRQEGRQLRNSTCKYDLPPPPHTPHHRDKKKTTKGRKKQKLTRSPSETKGSVQATNNSRVSSCSSYYIGI